MDHKSKAPAKFDLYNRNGTPLCHWVGCRKNSKNISSCYGGIFCVKHYKMMTHIRSMITHQIPPSQEELIARVLESRNRKILCPGHIEYISEHATAMVDIAINK